MKKVDFRGQMAPFTREDLQLIRAKLKAQEAWRDVALLNVGVDTMLRASDLVRLRVSMLREHTGAIAKAFAIRQTKTREPVHLGLSDRTRDAVAKLIDAEGKYGDDFLFTRRGEQHGQHISEVALRLLVKAWAAIAERDPAKYSGHSLRRTKAVLVYRETNNAELVRQMLGHTSLAHTVAYLGCEGGGRVGYVPALRDLRCQVSTGLRPEANPAERDNAYHDGKCSRGYRGCAQKSRRARNSDVYCGGRFRGQPQGLPAHGRRLGRLHRHCHQEGEDGRVLHDADRRDRQTITAGQTPLRHRALERGLITFPGGLPIVDEEGVLVGAIGVSGSAVENDNAVAEAGVKVVGVSDLPAHPWRT